MSKIDIDVKNKSFLEDNTFTPNHVHCTIKGKSINHVIINTLRRIILEDIPNYSFNSDKIKIIKNTSVYNNDYMRNRIENLPLFGINFPLNLKEYEIIRKYSRGRKSYEEVMDRKKIEEDNDDITKHAFSIYCNFKNSTDSIQDVTSNDLEYYKDRQKIQSIYPNKVLINRLKPGEEFEFSASVDKGIALNHSRYSVVGVCIFEMIKENEFLFKMEPRGSLKIKDIFERAFKIINFRLLTYLNKIMKLKFSEKNSGKIILNNEDHTFGNLLTRGLQDHKNIDFAGYKLEHLLIRDVIIEYNTNGGKTIKEILVDVINNFIKLFEQFDKKIKI